MLLEKHGTERDTEEPFLIRGKEGFRLEVYKKKIKKNIKNYIDLFTAFMEDW